MPAFVAIERDWHLRLMRSSVPPNRTAEFENREFAAQKPWCSQKTALCCRLPGISRA